MPEARQRLHALLQPHPRVALYAANPGAVDVMREIAPLLEESGQLAGWLLESWAAANLETDGLPALTSLEDTLDQLSGSGCLVLGSQVDFQRTQEVLQACRRRGIATLFVFDHWKNFRQHFQNHDGAICLPDRLALPDQLAVEGLRRSLVEAGTTPAELEPRMVVIGHPGIEATCRRIEALAPEEVEQVRQAVGISNTGSAALLLDPPPAAHDPDLGYDWRSTLDFLAAWLPRHRPGHRVVIKPHPRHSSPALDQALEPWRRQGLSYAITQEAPERLIAAVAEVWGMTTIALITALHCRRPIISFQPGRSLAGAEASNTHLEPYVVLSPEDCPGPQPPVP